MYEGEVIALGNGNLMVMKQHIHPHCDMPTPPEERKHSGKRLEAKAAA